MREARDLASRLAAEAKDSMNLFFTPVRVIVSEFARAVQQVQHEQSETKSSDKASSKIGAHG
jgi:hypothetical protein